ncbi:MAG TPA: hypothetical protein DHV28_13050 [Ignavibacteriales bacterium]|nr:hypothetical protein [Ignavibacteriales bacterium]
MISFLETEINIYARILYKYYSNNYHKIIVIFAQLRLQLSKKVINSSVNYWIVKPIKKFILFFFFDF